jgi:hypothetical protein
VGVRFLVVPFTDIIDIDHTHLQEMEHSLDADRDKEDTTTTSQTISPNKALLSLSLYFSSLILSLSHISFIPKMGYILTLHHMRPLLYRSKGYDDD